jgi:putative acetyltransferase
LCVLIREEEPADYAAIAEVTRAAFNNDAEAELIDRLRQEGVVITSLVAEEHGRILGHILFSTVEVMFRAAERVVLASLAPVAVAPDHQRGGIGSALVWRGIERCREAGHSAIILVGHPDYYSRFGFSQGVVAGLRNPFSSGPSFMGLELVRGALSGLKGQVVYPAAFDVLS